MLDAGSPGHSCSTALLVADDRVMPPSPRSQYGWTGHGSASREGTTTGNAQPRPASRLRSLWVLVLLFLLTPRGLSAAERPDLYVLAVGISHYQDPGIPTLSYADDDARAMVAWAKGQENRVYGQVHTLLLLDAEANRKNVLQALLEFFRPASPDDQLIFFLAGHGMVDPATGTWHALPTEAEAKNITGTGLEQHDLLSRLDLPGRPHNRLLVLMDTCHAGALGDALTSQTGRGGALVDTDVRPLRDQDVANRGGLWAVLSAGTARDKAQEGPTYRLVSEGDSVPGHGLFTFAVLKALATPAADRDQNGTVTLTEFLQYVTREVSTLSKGAQLPVMSGKVSDLALSFAAGTAERCDGIDNDLDDEVDEGFPDANRNGMADCLDKEVCNGVDDNGNGQVDEGFDFDRDGHRSMALCGSQFGDDCNDNDIATHPEQKDWGNLKDDDCDGLYDEDDFDLNQDGIPDLLGRKAAKLTLGRWSALGTGLLCLTASALTYGQLFETWKATSTELTQDQIEDYAGFSRATAVLSGVGTGLIGVSIGFTWEEMKFRGLYFPKRRSAIPSQVQTSRQALAKGGGK